MAIIGFLTIFALALLTAFGAVAMFSIGIAFGGPRRSDLLAFFMLLATACVLFYLTFANAPFHIVFS